MGRRLGHIAILSALVAAALSARLSDLNAVEEVQINNLNEEELQVANISGVGKDIENATLEHATRKRGRLGECHRDAYTWNDLELGRHVRQLRGTTACWFLSIVEGLYQQGYVEKWFTEGKICVYSASDYEELYEWTNDYTNTQGTFLKRHRYSLWQQVLEDMWDVGRPRHDTRNFQESVPPASMGSIKRHVEAEKYLRRVKPEIIVEELGDYKVMGYKTYEDFKDWYHTIPESTKNQVVCWQLDKNGVHAIAAYGPPEYYSDYGGHFINTYNQQLDYNRESEWQLSQKRGQKSVCWNYDDPRTTCDEIFAFGIYNTL